MSISFKLPVAALLAVSLSFAAQIPRPSGEFAILMNGGDPIQVSQYKGNAIVVVFLLTTCPHCQKTVGILAKLQKEYGPKGLQVLGCAVEDMASMYVPDFIKKFQPGFPVGYSLREPVQTYLQHPAMLRMMMPQVVLIDRQFVIQGQYAGDDPVFAGDQEGNLRTAIEPLLKSGAGGKTARPTIAR